ncbi:hypothetical protein L1999_13120 [Neobacillus drentensis]|uniref:hypothetical protein n=1 Tax=Neobacillus drentensis TaxID=220684 RepID=UPI001F2C9EBA|nr:hypothetical protein [Neobacillus drentensis]ULT59406.1 hypothetical protein L1999_13120 [Neobacillus drentensis]
MDFQSESEQHSEQGNDQEYKTSESTTRLEAEQEIDDSGFQKWFKNRKNTGHEAKGRGSSPSRFRSSKKKKKLELSWVKLLFKIIVVAIVCYNIYYMLDFAKNPFSDFTKIVSVVVFRAAINFMAVWILFYKNPIIRFYLSLMAIIGSFAYYFYVNYPNLTFLGDNLIPSILVLLSVLMAVNPKVNYYLKSIILLLIPIAGIYFNGNKFALVWTLMFNAGLILFFRVSKSKKSNKNKTEDQPKRNKRQTA